MMAVDAQSKIVPPECARRKAADLDLIGWSLERDTHQ
jgi:hypothetical protein